MANGDPDQSEIGLLIERKDKMRDQYVGAEMSLVKATVVTTVFVFGSLMLGCNKVEETKNSVKQAAEEATETAEEATDSVATTLGEEFDKAREAAKSALQGVDGGGEVMTKLSEFFSVARQAVHDVTDGDAAQAAADKLEELGQGLDEIGDKLAPLPEEARTAISAMIEKGTADLKAFIEKIDPTINHVVKPKLDALIDKLKAL